MSPRMNIRTRLFACVAGSTLISVLLGFAGLSAIGSLSDFFSVAADKTVEKMNLAHVISESSAELISDQRSLILATYSKDNFRASEATTAFGKHSDAFQKSLDKIRPLLVTEEAKVLVSDLGAKLSDWQSLASELARQCSAGNAEGALKFSKESIIPLSQKVEAAADHLVDIQADTLSKDKTLVADTVVSSRWISSGLLTLSLLSAAFMLFTIHKITDELRSAIMELGEGASQVGAAASQVASGSQSLAQDSSRQAASIQETSASTEEINSMARKNSESSRSAASLVGASQQKFTLTNRSLEEMVLAMSEITAGSNKISKIIKVIDEIAFQTNILALNAAVEAARAGEAGMGFAVVADEVRSLAQRSAQAARDTAALIEDSISKSKGGKVKVDEVAVAIHTITNEFSRIKFLVDEINLGSEEQTKGTAQIGRVIAQMEQSTQKRAASAEESASVAEELTAQSMSLAEVIKRLAKTMGREETPRPPVRPKKLPAPTVSRAALPEPAPVAAMVSLSRNDFPMDDDFKEF